MKLGENVANNVEDVREEEEVEGEELAAVMASKAPGTGDSVPLK